MGETPSPNGGPAHTQPRGQAVPTLPAWPLLAACHARHQPSGTALHSDPRGVLPSSFLSPWVYLYGLSHSPQTRNIRSHAGTPGERRKFNRAKVWRQHSTAWHPGRPAWVGKNRLGPWGGEEHSGLLANSAAGIGRPGRDHLDGAGREPTPRTPSSYTLDLSCRTH